MSRRLESLGLLALFCGGALWWTASARPVSAFQETTPPVVEQPAVERPAVETAPAKAVPAPPAFREEGIFHLHSASANEEDIQEALKDPKGVEIEFIDTPLKDAMEFLADAHEIRILIDEPALIEEGIAIDEPLNRTLSKIKLGSALKIILEPLGLTHIIEDEVLKITTIEAADQKRVTRVYCTGYLKQISVEPELLSKTIRTVIEPEHWRAAPAETATAEKQTIVVRDPQGRIQLGSPALLEALQAAAATPKSNPPQNSLGVLGDMLVVSAPRSVHAKIQDLLAQLDRRWEKEHGQKK